jgi:glycosyltransferase involved in cell wall biosynthesis
MQSDLKVSLIVPIHGDAIYLLETLESIKNITFDSFEVIFVFDRASENVQLLVRNFCENMKNVKSIFTNGFGISNALNSGIAVSRSEFIARLDADDIILPNRIERQYSFLAGNPRFVLVGTQMTLFKSVGKESIRRTTYPVHNRAIKAVLKMKNCIGHPTVMFRKSIFYSAGQYRTYFNGAEDFDLWTRMSKLGKFKNLNENLTLYRISETQYSKSFISTPGVLEESVLLSSRGIISGLELDYMMATNIDRIMENNDVIMKTLSTENRRVFRYFKSLKLLYSIEGQIRRQDLRFFPNLFKALIFAPLMAISYLTYDFKTLILGKIQNVRN